MRASTRRRHERLIVELAAEASPQLARAIRVVWARSLPDVTWAFVYGFTKQDQWLVLDEQRWRESTDEERADTAAHELAHLLSKDDGHGAEFRKAHRRLLRAALEMEWQ